MDIRGLVLTSAIEWPGKIVSVIFTSGCNFRCPFCHNSTLVLTPNDLPKYEQAKLFTEFEKRKKWLDGVAVTGGEPTLQEDLRGFLSRLKQMGLLTMVETNGSRPKVLDQLIKQKLLDRIAMDIKGPLGQYDQITKIQLPITKIKESIELVVKSGIECEFRTTVVPGIHDEKVLIQMAEQINELTEKQKNVKTEKPTWVLQKFIPRNCIDPEFNKLTPYTDEEMDEILKKVKVFYPDVALR